MPAIRKLCVADASHLAALESMCFTLPWTPEQCAGALEQKHFSALGLWAENRLLGYVSFYHMDEHIEILNIAVHPDWRRLGYGDMLLGMLLRVGAKMGMQRTVLETREHNFPAISLYKKNGFRQCGTRPRYYADSGEAALVFERTFIHS